MTGYTIGIDVSKALLDVHRLPDGRSAQFGNDKKGHKALIRAAAEVTTTLGGKASS